MANNQERLNELGVFSLLADALAMQSPGVSMSLRQAPKQDAAPAVPKRGLLERLDYWFWKREQAAMEAYLAQAKDVFELEARLRNLERGASLPYY